MIRICCASKEKVVCTVVTLLDRVVSQMRSRTHSDQLEPTSYEGGVNGTVFAACAEMQMFIDAEAA